MAFPAVPKALIVNVISKEKCEDVTFGIVIGPTTPNSTKPDFIRNVKVSPLLPPKSPDTLTTKESPTENPFEGTLSVPIPVPTILNSDVVPDTVILLPVCTNKPYTVGPGIIFVFTTPVVESLVKYCVVVWTSISGVFCNAK